MQEYNGHKYLNLGYFLGNAVWEDALKLLNFQISQRQNNRHYNTLSIFYYEKICKECMLENPSEYFSKKITNNLFYGLKNEFLVYHHVIPKKGLSLRDYVFFTYPARVLYYAIGLYLLRLSEEFLFEVHGKLKQVHAFYGGNLKHKDNQLSISKQNTYYRPHYDQYTGLIEQETSENKDNKVIIKIDIENYFGTLKIPLLLEKLDMFVKPSIKSKMRFDVLTKDQICTYFEFLMHGNSGIPQAENNIVSNLIGHIFMLFGDLLIDDLLGCHNDLIDEYKIIRYVDDINVSMVFKEEVSFEKQGEFTLYIAAQIAETLYQELNLRLNLKTRAYHLREPKDEEELRLRVKTLISQDNAGFDYDSYQEESNCNIEAIEESGLAEQPQQKLHEIFKALRKLKKTNIEDYFIRSNVSIVSEKAFRDIFDKSVYQILGKQDNLRKMRRIFDDFNFDLIKARPFELTILILRDQETTDKFRRFLEAKESITTTDADLIIKYLCQTNFENITLLKKLSMNSLLKDVIELILEAKRNCEIPGYYDLSCMEIRKISEMPEVIEQMRMRIFYERNQSYSVALNHLLNEIHALCIRKEGADKKKYDANMVFKYLISKNIPCETRIKIRNLFDRRNYNGVSHPGSDDRAAWEVTKEEYDAYHKHVGLCLRSLLLS